MSTSETEWRELRKIMYAANLGWLVERDREFMVQRLEGFARTYAEKTAGTAALPRSASIHDLFAEHQKNPHRLKVLLQALAFGCSAEILAMVWAVLLGSTIERLSYQYERRKSSQLTCDVMFPDGTLHTFVGRDHWDTAILRLASLSQADGKPLIESFYPLHVPRGPGGSRFFRILQVLEWIRDFKGSPAFCPSVIDSEHVQEIADAIVDGVKSGWLEPVPGGALAASRTGPSAEAEARALLAKDAAVVVALTVDGRRALRRGQFYRQLHPASAATLTMVRKEIERVLGNPSGEYSAEDLDEIRDELAAIEQLLHEAGDPAYAD